MSEVVIRAEGLGKKYLIGHQAQEERYVALRDVIARNTKGLMRSARDMLHGRQLIEGDEIEEFWALKDVSFEIKRGDVVGVIGRNGAGKSTLLKILSRITEPSMGRVEIKGRVASLLEVGTGFHPELSGRENIYLNGAILGMTRAEIRRKFDEIVDFAGVEKFIDTPVKRYSSGMQMRLAFAVAAHLDPEILIVDEVLAVGDTEFQKKCLGKMGQIAQRGDRTVLFVSHQMGVVAQLCEKSILMARGEKIAVGETRSVIEKYITDGQRPENECLVNEVFLTRMPAAVLTLDAVSKDGNAVSDFGWNEGVNVRVRVRINEHLPGLTLGVAIQNRLGVTVTTWVTRIINESEARERDYLLAVAPSLLAPGGYSFVAAVFVPNGHVFHKIEAISPIVIHDSGSPMAAFGDVDYGVVILPAVWSDKTDSAAKPA